MRRHALLLPLVAVLVAATGAAAGTDAYPGHNGKLAFVSNGKIYTLKPGQPKKLLATGGDPAWSPNGLQVALSRDGDIWVIKANGTGLTQLGNGGGAYAPSWSPDGLKLAFERYDSIYVMNKDGSGVTPVIEDEGAGDLSKWLPAWSPKGDRLAFVLGDGEHSGNIYSIKPDGTGLKQLTTVAGNVDTDPAWSPNGKRIAFTRYVDCAGGECVNAVFVMSASGGGQTLLRKNAANPAWSPDGTRVLYEKRLSGQYPTGNVEIYSMRKDGSSPVRYTHSAATDGEPDWQPVP